MGKGVIRLEKQEENILITENYVTQVRKSFELNLYAFVKAVTLFQKCRHVLNTGWLTGCYVH